MKVVQFWLVRHGQTEENVKQILCGQQGGTLTPLGIRQAEALGKRLSTEKFDYAFVSDLTRTRHTFDCINKFQQNKFEVEFTPLIREKSAGVLDGQSLALPKQLAAQQKIPLREFRPEKGEAWVDVMQRAMKMIEILATKFLLNDFQTQFSQLNISSPPQLQQQMKIQPQQQQVQQQQFQFQPLQKNIEPQIKGKASKLTPKPKIVQKVKNPNVIQVLGVAHGGFIMEFINAVKLLMEKKEPTYCNDSGNCSITIFEISCKNQPMSTNILEGLDIKILLKNDHTHCKNIK